MVEAIGRGITFVVVMVLSGSVFSGCGSSPRREAAPEYPEEVARGEVLDVQVRRDVTKITLTNTSSRDLSRGMMWLNMRFAHRLNSFSPGETITLDLEEFRDSYGSSYRAGGFFSRELPDPIVLAQVQTKEADGSDVLVGLISVLNKKR